LAKKAKKEVSNVETDTGPASLLQTEAICQLKDDTKMSKNTQQ